MKVVCSTNILAQPLTQPPNDQRILPSVILYCRVKIINKNNANSKDFCHSNEGDRMDVRLYIMAREQGQDCFTMIYCYFNKVQMQNKCKLTRCIGATNKLMYILQTNLNVHLHLTPLLSGCQSNTCVLNIQIDLYHVTSKKLEKKEATNQLLVGYLSFLLFTRRQDKFVTHTAPA